MDRERAAAYRDAMISSFFRQCAAKVLLAGIGVFIFGADAWSGPAALASHKASYDVRLNRAPSGAGILGAAGRATYKVVRDCSGWLVENHTSLLLTYEGDRTVQQRWSLASWESEDGRAFRARVVDYKIGGDAERITSKAALSDSGGKAVFSEPESIERDLPAGTVFPMKHLAEIFDVARSGGTQVRRVLFDGGNMDNPYTVNVAIFGEADTARAAAVAKRFGLSNMPGWRVHMAFFRFGTQAAIPDYEITGSFRADGIAYDLIQDFGDFSLRLNLKKLKPIVPDC